MSSSIKFTSRASIKIGESYYTFEACIEKPVPLECSEEEYKTLKKDLWDEANNEVDTQIEETVEFLKKKR